MLQIGNRTEIRMDRTSQISQPQQLQQFQVFQTKEKLNVVTFMPSGLNSLIKDFREDVHNFQGRIIRRSSKNCYKYTRDPYTLEIVSSELKLEL